MNNQDFHQRLQRKIKGDFMATLFELTQDKIALDQLIDEVFTDGEGNTVDLNEDTKQKLLQMADDWKGDFQAKAERICQFIVELKGFAEMATNEALRIEKQKKKAETKIKALNYIIQNSMSWLNLTKFQAGLFTVSIQKNPPSCIVDDEGLIPHDYTRLIPERVELDKKKIIEAIKGGLAVPGARIEQSSSVRIK